jgi:hypothetical protein
MWRKEQAPLQLECRLSKGRMLTYKVLYNGSSSCLSQAVYPQDEASESSAEVVSLLAGVPGRLAEIAQQGLSTAAALVAVGALYAYLDI